MVTFVCEFCDVTLKKKQCDRHISNQCSPGSLICIDCSKTFKGQSYKQHTSCISEQDKHWGQFAKSKQENQHKKKQNGNQWKNSQNQDKGKINGNQEKSIFQEKKEEKVKPAKEQVEHEGEQEEKVSSWRGWKNEIKSLIKENKNLMEKEEVVKKIRKIYNEKVEDAEQVSDEFIEEKIRSIKKAKELVYIILQ